ncbi:MAG: hypothetical protein HY248_02205, partial [Fimbriimonas ginsengisoli]|nr:hypothetical protein [Fimbriimonas ginsengisoli]
FREEAERDEDAAEGGWGFALDGKGLGELLVRYELERNEMLPNALLDVRHKLLPALTPDMPPGVDSARPENFIGF